MRTRRRVPAALLAVVAAACLGGDGRPSGPSASPTGALDRRDFGGRQADVHGAIHIETSNATVVMHDRYYEPNVVSGPARLAVTLMLRNEGTQLHNLSIPSLQVDQDIPPTSIVAVPVVMPPAGDVVFFCRFHRDDGMLGALVAD
jgi:hypothetical protein